MFGCLFRFNRCRKVAFVVDKSHVKAAGRALLGVSINGISVLPTLRAIILVSVPFFGRNNVRTHTKTSGPP